MKSIANLLTISRPISWVNTSAPFVAGYFLSVGVVDWRLIFGAIFFLIPYNLLMYGVNDIFDYESDKDNPRKNSVEGGLAPPKIHSQIWLAIAVTCVPALLVMFSWGNVTAKVWLAVLLFMVVAYSMKGLRFKEIPFLDSFTSSTHFYGPLVYGLLLGGTLTGYYPAIAAFVLWGMASHALGAVQDIKWDRLAGIGSISTVIGARATIILCFLLYLASASIAVGFYASFAALIIGLSLCLYPLIVSRAFAVSDETAEKTNILWKQFLWINQVTGFAITMLYIGSKSGEQPMFVTHIAALVAVGAAYGYILQKWSTLKIAP